MGSAEVRVGILSFRNYISCVCNCDDLLFIPFSFIPQFKHMKLLYRKSSIKPPSPGAYLFQAHLRRSLIETGGIFKREGLFNLEKTTVSVLHKELEYKVEKLKYKKVGDAAEDQNQIRTSSW